MFFLDDNEQVACRYLQESDYILLVGGEELSAAAGLDGKDYKLFQDMFPAMQKLGFYCMDHVNEYKGKYCPDGTTAWTEELKWGYLSELVLRFRFQNLSQVVYQDLLRITMSTRQNNTFILSPNKDGMFCQNGFDVTRIYNPDGDWSRMQCSKPCRTDAYWPSKPVLSKIFSTVDKSTQKCVSSAVPVCPHCSGPVDLNVNSGDGFIEDIGVSSKDFGQFLQSTKGKRLTVLEVGVEFASPFRCDVEEIIRENSLAKLIRINAERSDVPQELEERCVSMKSQADDAIRHIAQTYFYSLAYYP